MAKRVLKRRAKVNIPICAAGILLCLTLFSTHLTSGIYARYSTTAAAGDSARVIKFGQITLTEYGEDTQYIVPGVNLTWGATVDFDGSESATYVFLEVEPTGTSWSVSEDKKTYTFFENGPYWMMADGWEHIPNTENPYVYYRALGPNTPLESAPVVANGVIFVREDLTQSELAEMSNSLTVKFRASVVQSNGFDSVEAAWTSLSTNH